MPTTSSDILRWYTKDGWLLGDAMKLREKASSNVLSASIESMLRSIGAAVFLNNPTSGLLIVVAVALHDYSTAACGKSAVLL